MLLVRIMLSYRAELEPLGKEVTAVTRMEDTMKKIFWLMGISLSLVPAMAFSQDAVPQEGTTQETVKQDTAKQDTAKQDAVRVAQDPSQMLPQEIEDRFKSMRSDPDPDQLVRDAHYWVSNENAHYVWYPHIKDRGGVLSGVGTDQVYLLAGWSNASIVIPMDFDRQIRNLHFAYGAAFLASENIDEFRTYWKKENADKMKAALEKYFPSEVDVAMKAWKHGASEVNGRIRRVIKKYTADKGAGVPTFLTDDAQYQRIRQLWQNHRVFPICGDLTGDKAMLDIAKALNDSGLKMTILYPSNAEHYFEYSPSYRRNIINMPFADNSLVLRTRQMRSLGLAEDEDYHYNMQTGENFIVWLKTTNIKDQHSMLRKRSKTETTGLSVLDYVPEPSAKEPQIAPVP